MNLYLTRHVTLLKFLLFSFSDFKLELSPFDVFRWNFILCLLKQISSSFCAKFVWNCYCNTIYLLFMNEIVLFYRHTPQLTAMMSHVCIILVSLYFTKGKLVNFNLSQCMWKTLKYFLDPRTEKLENLSVPHKILLAHHIYLCT